MRYVKDLGETPLFDVFESFLHPMAYHRMRQGWQHLFRESILALMPVEAVGEHFDPIMGQPTKELYSMCGLIFIMEFKNWTSEEAAESYTTSSGLRPDAFLRGPLANRLQLWAKYFPVNKLIETNQRLSWLHFL